MGRQEKAALWDIVSQIKARQQHDESHPSEAGDLFKGGGSEEGSRETSAGMQRRGEKGAKRRTTCWVTAIMRLRRAEPQLLRVKLRIPPTPFRRTKWCFSSPGREDTCDRRWETEERHKTVLQHEIAPPSLFSHLRATEWCNWKKEINR